MTTLNKIIAAGVLAGAVAFSQVSTPLTVVQSAGSLTGEIRLQERRTNGQEHVGFRAPQSVGTSLLWDLPSVDGTNGQALTTNGAGVLSWSSGSSLPVADTTSIVSGSADATKLLRFEVDGFTTATTRVLTPQNASYTVAGIDIAQTFTAAQSVAAQLSVTSGNSLRMDRSSRGINQKAYWTVSGNTSTTGAWSTGTTPSGAASRWVIDHNGTEHFVLDENGLLTTTAGANFNGIVSTTTFNATGSPAYRVSGTTVIDASRNASIVGLTINGNITGDLLPSSAFYVIGNGSSQWLAAHIGTINAYTSVLPDTDGGADLGASSKRFANSYLNTVEIAGVIQPDVSNTRNNGANTRRWATTFTQNLNITGTVTAPDANAGWSGTRTVRNAADTGSCTLIFSGGILTGGTC
ncbi:MAG: hypothetical protein ABFD89_13260 [Bryobacteraceae bacterium]